MYQFAYFFGLSIAVIIWTFLFLRRRDLRKEQITMGLVSSPLGPISQIFWFSKSYWAPIYLFPVTILGVKVGFEEVLFGFLVGGISSVVYEVLLKRKHAYGKSKTLEAFILFLSGALLFYFFIIMGFNPIWASSLALIISALIMSTINNNLRIDLLYSGLFMLAVALAVYSMTLLLFPELVERFWIQEGLSGISIFGIPVEELIWFISWGVFSGIFYEFSRNVRYYPHIKRG